MHDVRTMPALELLRGLMRGDRRELKLGYSPMNAVLAVKRLHPAEDEKVLRGHAEGFSDGMHRDPSMWVNTDPPTPEHLAYREGYALGEDEDDRLTYPSREPV